MVQCIGVQKGRIGARSGILFAFFYSSFSFIFHYFSLFLKCSKCVVEKSTAPDRNNRTIRYSN
ncbi:hypothetical protein BDV25DRAFT_165877 [Aspergillus avenaceus]|uniref:Uncharacterized protein n=1 Tax=Aspergillus avenaceus TaxID=36643 RepID=A0A5N6TET1_ASPAV|nr:hypothetical protein BDV25DRAFT_165877 [Aspergillus avenaceus]